MEDFNGKHTEFNGLPQKETNKIPPNTAGEELQPSPENITGSEFQNTSSATGKRKKKKSSFSHRIGTFILGITAAATIGVSAILPARSADAQIIELKATDTQITYRVSVSDTDLRLVVYNDFTRREAELSEGENEGKIEGLQPDMRYTVAVQADYGFGDTSVTEQKIRTLTPEEASVTAMNSVTHECTCNVDGYFHFTMDFVDENGWWSQFEATLKDADGNIAKCAFTDDLHAEQKIDVVGNNLIGNTAEFTIACISTQNDEEGERIVLYSETVKI